VAFIQFVYEIFAAKMQQNKEILFRLKLLDESIRELNEKLNDYMKREAYENDLDNTNDKQQTAIEFTALDNAV